MVYSDASQWRVELSSQWNVLGPFPIHAREQHYLSPSYPLNLSKPIDWSATWPSSYADGGFVSWTSASADINGNLTVSFPDIRWASLRATEGWAALQHHAILKTQLVLHPPPIPQNFPSNVLVRLNQASFFTIIPSIEDNAYVMPTPIWYQGNIYNSRNVLPQTVKLPNVPSPDAPTTYDIFVSGDYEIRLFGDPRNADSNVPEQKLNFTVELEEASEPVLHEPTQNIVCDFIKGFSFGTAIGVGLRSVSGWWTVRSITLLQPAPSNAFNLTLLHEVRLAPSQMRIVPLCITQRAPIYLQDLQFSLNISSAGTERNVTVILPIRQLSLWSAQNHEPIRATYFYATSMPTYFVAIPPKSPEEQKYCPPILALHGAGVDIVHENFWSEALPRQQHSWIVIPSGRTPWGLDWHGPSAQDAWDSVDALSAILDTNTSWRPWGYVARNPVVLVGHSNGGQGAWYLASRFPDRVLGVVPAAAYIKSQAYIPLTMSRSAHYIDPALRAILESAFTPDDNDLHFSNLVHMPICAVHGGNDENVPVWHTREAIGILETWSTNSRAPINFKEDKTQGHWYSSVFRNDTIKSFLDGILLNPSQSVFPKSFTLTVANPAEHGSVYGWRVHQLLIPGRLGRMQIEITSNGIAKIFTSNVRMFSIDRDRYTAVKIVVDGIDIDIQTGDSTVLFERIQRNKWKILARSSLMHIQPSGRLQLILTSTAPITIVVPTRSYFSHELSVALRLAYCLHTFHQLDAEIIDESEALVVLDQDGFAGGNAVVLGGTTMALVDRILSLGITPFSIRNLLLTLNGHSVDLERSESAVAFLHPRIGGFQGSLLFMLSSSVAGLERAIRLFPIRTGVAVPDWIIISKDADQVGAAGVQGAGLWGRHWSWNQIASWSVDGFD